VIFDFFITNLLNQYVLFEGALGFVRIIGNVIIALIFMKSSVFEKIVVCTLSDITLLIISFLSLNILSGIFGFTVPELIEMNGLIRIINLFVTKFVFFMFTRIIIAIKKKEAYTLNLTEWIVLVTIFLITVFAEMKIFDIAVEFKLSESDPSILAVGSGLFLIDILVYILMSRISRKNLERTQLLIDKMQLDVYKDRLTETQKQYNEIKSIRHDMKNHLQCILSLIKKTKYDESQEYVEDMLENKLDFVYQFIDTNNNIINVISNAKLTLCRNEKIKTVINISSFRLEMDDSDICVILGNLFDNAIEACKKIDEDKMIYFEISQKKGYVNFIIKNSIKKSVLKSNPNLKTNKSNAVWHGIGLKSAKETVSRYGGMIDFYENNDLFAVDVWIPSEKIE
jgi:two-component system sensor histidine kinase AgrC